VSSFDLNHSLTTQATKWTLAITWQCLNCYINSQLVLKTDLTLMVWVSINISHWRNRVASNGPCWVKWSNVKTLQIDKWTWASLSSPSHHVHHSKEMVLFGLCWQLKWCFWSLILFDRLFGIRKADLHVKFVFLWPLCECNLLRDLFLSFYAC